MTPMKEYPDPFEIKVMNLAIRGSSDWHRGMRKQIPFLRVTNRIFNGSGFVTYFSLTTDAEPVVVPRDDDNLPINGYPPAVNAIRSDPETGLVSFIVWLGDDGKIHRLEACALTDDQWPYSPFHGFHSFQDDDGVLISPSSIAC